LIKIYLDVLASKDLPGKYRENIMPFKQILFDKALISVYAIIQTEDPESKKKSLLIIERKTRPFKGLYALPGCFIGGKDDEKLSLIQEIRDEIGLNIKKDSLKRVDQEFRYFDNNKVFSLAYLGELEGKFNREDKIVKKKLKHSKTVSEVFLIPLTEIRKLNLAFNHEEMVEKSGILLKS